MTLGCWDHPTLAAQVQSSLQEPQIVPSSFLLSFRSGVWQLQASLIPLKDPCPWIFKYSEPSRCSGCRAFFP